MTTTTPTPHAGIDLSAPLNAMLGDIGSALQQYWWVLAPAIGALIGLAFAVRAVERWAQDHGHSLFMEDEELEALKQKRAWQELLEENGIDQEAWDSYAEAKKEARLRAKLETVAKWSQAAGGNYSTPEELKAGMGLSRVPEEWKYDMQPEDQAALSEDLGPNFLDLNPANDGPDDVRISFPYDGDDVDPDWFEGDD